MGYAIIPMADGSYLKSQTGAELAQLEKAVNR